MLNGLLKKLGFPFFHLCRKADEFLRKLPDKNREVKGNDSSSAIPRLTRQRESSWREIGVNRGDRCIEVEEERAEGFSQLLFEA
jgi:hypothetical protein